MREQTTIELLIGDDHYAAIMLPERTEVQPGPYLLNSHLGWIISSLPQLTSPETPTSEATTPSLLIMNVPHLPVATAGQPELPCARPLDKPQLYQFWDLESIDIHGSARQSDADHHRAHALFQGCIWISDKRTLI